MKKNLQENRFFFLLMLLYLFLGIFIVLQVPKGNEVLWLNSKHNSVLDVIFVLITWLGDGIFSAAVALIFWFFNRQKSILLWISFLATSLVVRVLKQIVFEGEPRPATFFKDKFDLHFVDGLETSFYNSMPSGHTATAFALFAMFAFCAKDKRWAALLMLVGIAVAWSRVYLAQHFFVDTLAGATLGVVISFLVYTYAANYIVKFLNRKAARMEDI